MFGLPPRRKSTKNAAAAGNGTTGAKVVPIAAARAGRADGHNRPDPEAVLRRLEWTVIKRLDGLLQGDYRTLFRGFGLDLADLREYQPHDDVR